MTKFNGKNRTHPLQMDINLFFYDNKLSIIVNCIIDKWKLRVRLLPESPGQTIATCQRNISQHCWVQHVACVWPPCCDVLRHVGSNLTIFKLEPTTPNMSQHVATGWPNAPNMLHPTMLRCVAMACCDRLARA